LNAQVVGIVGGAGAGAGAGTGTNIDSTAADHTNDGVVGVIAGID